MTESERSASRGGGGRSDFCFRAVSAPGQVPARARNQHERAPPPPERKQAETALLGSRLRGNDGEGSGNDEKGGGNEGNRNGRKERPRGVEARAATAAPRLRVAALWGTAGPLNADPRLLLVKG